MLIVIFFFSRIQGFTTKNSEVHQKDLAELPEQRLAETRKGKEDATEQTLHRSCVDEKSARNSRYKQEDEEYV